MCIFSQEDKASVAGRVRVVDKGGGRIESLKCGLLNAEGRRAGNTLHWATEVSGIWKRTPTTDQGSPPADEAQTMETLVHVALNKKYTD